MSNEKVVDDDSTGEADTNETSPDQTDQDLGTATKGSGRTSTSEKADGSAEGEEFRILAFKALPPRSAAAKTRGSSDDTAMIKELSENEVVEQVTDEIYRLVSAGRKDDKVVVVAVEEEKKKSKGDDDGKGDGKEKKMWKIENGDIIGAAEARKSTTYLESLGYSLKKLVWS